MTDFDDLGPSLSDVVATVPFATHTARRPPAAGGVVDYDGETPANLLRAREIGAEGALGRQTDARTALRALEGAKPRGCVSSDSMSEEALRGPARAELRGGMPASTTAGPAGDNPTSRRIPDAVAAGASRWRV